jgi:hypothetical protein
MDLILQQVLVRYFPWEDLNKYFFEGLPPTMNGLDHSHRQQPYLNQVNVHKHHAPQHTIPVQSAFLASPPVARNGLSPSSSANVYHFSQNNFQQVKKFYSMLNSYFLIKQVPSSSGGGQSRHHPQRQDVTVTTYL